MRLLNDLRPEYNEILDPRVAQEVRLGPFKTKQNTVYSVVVHIHRRGPHVKSMRLKASNLRELDVEMLNLAISEDLVFTLGPTPHFGGV